MKTFSQIGTEIGELVEQKAAAYGESFAKCGEYLRMLYPNGITPEEYSIAMLLARDFDKSMRLATNPYAFGESPFVDKAGYAILGAHMHQQRKASEPCPGTASADAAKSSNEDRPGSAATPNASATIMPSTAGRNAPEPLPQPDGCCEQLTSAPAPNATEAAGQNAGDRLVIRSGRSRHDACMDCDIRDGNAYCTMNCGPRVSEAMRRPR